MSFPELFVTDMKQWLGQQEWSALQYALDNDAPYRGVRLHRMVSPEHNPSVPTMATSSPAFFAVGQAKQRFAPRDLLQLGDIVPWYQGGHYISTTAPFGKHVYHEMGAYYIQEPSAMAVVSALEPQPGERILDLCAAPGGKASGIAARMGGQGLFVANEIHPTRAQVLVQNLERLGIPCVITQDDPLRLRQAWVETFDAILVDAPCSGEGMFRKDVDARDQWSREAVRVCADRQRTILEAAVSMLKPGGRLVYSTCTFNPVENEQTVAWVVEHLAMDIEPLPDWPYWEPGRDQWTGPTPVDMSGTRRLWPHRGPGEGHFIARLRKRESSLQGARLESAVVRQGRGRARTGSAKSTATTGSPWNALASIGLPESLIDVPTLHVGRHVYVGVPTDLRLQGVHVLRPGVCAAVQDRNHWEPHHHLAMAVAADQFGNESSLTKDELLAYFRGESLPPKANQGFCRVTLDGIPAGWVKQVSGRMNNLYPRGLRRHDLLSD